MTAGDHSERAHTRAVYVISAAAEGGDRRYSDADIAILKRISELTDQGLNLEGIRRVMHLEIKNTRLRAELDQARDRPSRHCGR